MSESTAETQGQQVTVTDEMIEARAYEISQEDGAGSAEENWQRAEQELRGRGRDADGDSARPPL